MSSIASPLTGKSGPERTLETAFGCPRDFLGNRFVYAVISPRARGLSIGINVNPDAHCNFDCPYCEVDRRRPASDRMVDISLMAEELRRTLDLVVAGGLRFRAEFARIPSDLLKLQHVALSGDGEPTLSSQFAEIVQAAIHVRARGNAFFKLVLITNSTGLCLPAVQDGINCFTSRDEVWAKLDAGTQEYMNRINKAQCSLREVMASILVVARRRPVVIQSLFPALHGEEPGDAEIEAYAQRLHELVQAGAKISLVQIYSATRPTPHSECGHLSLKTLSRIAQTVRRVTGLPAEVF